MKKLLIVLAACGGSSKQPVVAPPEPPVATRGPDQTEPPPDAADRKHAFVITASQLPWARNHAEVGPDQHFLKLKGGETFAVPVGVAVAATGVVTNEKGEQVAAWNAKEHALRCMNDAECTVFIDSAAKPDSFEKIATDLAWSKADPSRDDLIAPLWGDAKAGPNGFLMKMKPGSSPFWHIHRRDYHGVVLAGTVVSYESGKEPKEMGPGSYWWQPNGNKHTTDCKGTTECIVYMNFTGAYDVKAVP